MQRFFIVNVWFRSIRGDGYYQFLLPSAKYPRRKDVIAHVMANVPNCSEAIPFNIIEVNEEDADEYLRED